MQRRSFIAGTAVAGLAGLSAPNRARAAVNGSDIVIGLSNGYFGTEWRNQLVAGAQAQFKMYKAKAKAGKLIVQQAGADINQQIQDVRNMILQGVSVITIDANSATALDGVINEAKRAGIPVIAFDQAVAESLCAERHGRPLHMGDALCRLGCDDAERQGQGRRHGWHPGQPGGRDARNKAAFDTFKKYPGIEIVWSGYGYWDQAKAQNVMATVIAAQPQIDGAFVEDSMGLGVLRAFQNARRPIPVMTAEAQKAFLIAWKQELANGTNMQAFAQPNPPDISRNAIGIAVRLAAGRKLKPQPNNTIYYPIHLEVTRDNLDQTSGGDEGRARQLLPGRVVLGSRSLMLSSPDAPVTSRGRTAAVSGRPRTTLLDCARRHANASVASSRSMASISPCRGRRVLGLLGANGSGKSTLSRIIAGEVAPRRRHHGDGGAALRHASPQAAARSGIIIAHQHPSLAPDMPVWENIFLGCRALPRRRFHRPRRRPPNRRAALLADARQHRGYRAAGGHADRGRAAAGGDRPRSRAHPAPADPGRADRRAGGRRGREALRRHPPADGARHRRHLHLPPARRRSRRSATTSW